MGSIFLVWDGEGVIDGDGLLVDATVSSGSLKPGAVYTLLVVGAHATVAYGNGIITTTALLT